MIALDLASAKGQNSTATVTLSHTITGLNTLLLVGIVYQGASDDVTGVTWNGVSMTRLKGPDPTNGANERIYIYGLLGAATGTHNIVVSKTGTVNFVTFYGVSYTGVDQNQTLPDASNSAQGNGAAAQVSITTVKDNCWMFGVCRPVGGSGHAAGANTTLRWDGSDAACICMDTNATQTPPGSHNLNVSWTTSVNYGIDGVSFAPVATGADFLFGMV